MERIMKMNLRKTAATAGLGLIMLGATALPAGAGEKIEFTDSWTANVVNPCTGAPTEAYLTATITAHNNKNSFVANIHTSGVTSDGYVVRAVDPVVGNQNVFSDVTNGIHTHPESGSKYRVHSHLKVDVTTGTVIYDVFDATCIKP
jgi:hypothetical protein